MLVLQMKMATILQSYTAKKFNFNEKNGLILYKRFY